MYPHGVFKFHWNAPYRVLLCINSISLQFYTTAIKELVAFQAAFKHSAAYEVGWGSKVAGSVKVTTPLVPSLQFTDLQSFKN